MCYKKSIHSLFKAIPIHLNVLRKAEPMLAPRDLFLSSPTLLVQLIDHVYC